MVATTAQTNDRANAFAGRQIRNYLGNYNYRWRYHPALRRGTFNKWDAWAMLRDPAIQMGMLALMSPFPSVHYEVRANSKEIKTFIENTVHRFWTHDLQKVLLHYLPHGTFVGEVLYDRDQDAGLWKYAGIDDFHLDEVQALRRGRVLTGARISHGSALLAGMYLPGDGNRTNELRPPKLFWCSHKALCGDLFGLSVFEPSWDAWMEKVGAHGAIDIRKLWAFSNAFRGAIVTYPPGTTNVNGVEVDNQDIAREIGEKYATGASMTMPFEPDEHGNNQWSVQDPKMNGEIRGLIEYPDKLDEAMWMGMDCPPEAIRSIDTQGWGNAKGAPMLMMLNGVDLKVREVMTAFDVGPGGYTSRAEQSGGVVRPLVMENFGGKARYEIKVWPLVPKAQPPGPGGTGGAPPGGAPPPPPGGGAAPVMGQPPAGVALSAAAPVSVEVPNDLVSKILGRELPAALSASEPAALGAAAFAAARAAYDHKKHPHKGKGTGGGQFTSSPGASGMSPEAQAQLQHSKPEPKPGIAKRAVSGAVHAEHAAAEYVTRQVNKLPTMLRVPVKAAFKSAYATYIGAAAAVAAVAKERGLSEEQQQTVTAACATWDAVLGMKVMPWALAATGAGATVAAASSFIPAASLCYLAFSTAKDPMSTLRAAQKAVGGAIAARSANMTAMQLSTAAN